MANGGNLGSRSDEIQRLYGFEPTPIEGMNFIALVECLKEPHSLLDYDFLTAIKIDSILTHVEETI